MKLTTAEQMKELDRQAKEVNLKLGRPCVVLTGPRTDINVVAAACDLFVGVSRSALEAMAAGTLSGTVQNAKEMPQVLMDLALSLYAGEDPAQAADLTAEHYVWLPYREVNRENFRSFQEE